MMSGWPKAAHAIWGWAASYRAGLRRIGLGLAVIAFAAGLYWSLRDFPASLTPDVWPLLLLFFICYPVAVALSAAEFQVMAGVAGLRIGWTTAFETTVFASAANMLPLPGGAITRVAALKAAGATLRVGSILAVLFAAIWGGLAFCLSGTFLVLEGQWALGWLFAAGGTILLGASVTMLRRFKASTGQLTQAFAIRVASLLVDVFAQMLTIWSLGATIGFGEASVFAVSGFLGGVASFVPAGLGVRELVVAALSPLVALSPMVGFLSVAIGRAMAMLLLAVLSAGLLIAGRGGRAAARSPDRAPPG